MEQEYKAKEIIQPFLSMKIISFIVKGILDPSKGKKIKVWLKQQDNFDAIILIEIKCASEELLQRLDSINNQLKWIVFSHKKGFRGIFCGIKNQWASQTWNNYKDPFHQWLAIELKEVVSIKLYANYPQISRDKIWESMTNNFKVLIIMIGDLIMV